MGEPLRAAEGPDPLAARLAAALRNAQGDTRFAIEAFLMAAEGGHPATLELHTKRGNKGIEAKVESGPHLA